MGYFSKNMIQIPIESFTFKNQSDVVSPQGIHFSKWNPDAQHFQFLKSLDENCTTLYEAFRFGAKKSAGGRCVGWRPTPFVPYQWLTYDEVLRRAENFGSGLLQLGLSQRDTVSIYGETPWHQPRQHRHHHYAHSCADCFVTALANTVPITASY